MTDQIVQINMFGHHELENHVALVNNIIKLIIAN